MVRWEWNRKQGEMEHNGCTLDIYDGNCLFVALQRQKQEDDGNWTYYMPPFFWDDEAHAKRCLGLVKDSDDLFENLDLKVTLYRKMWDKATLKKIVGLFAQRTGNTTIEIKENEE